MDYKDLKQLARQIKEDTKLEDYFSKLVNNGVLKFDKPAGGELYYKKLGQHTGSISVNPDKNIWYDHSEDKGGDIFSAVEYFEGVKGYVNQVKHLDSNSFEFKQIHKKRASISKPKDKFEFELLRNEKDINHPALLRYLDQRGLNLYDVRGVLNEVHWKNGDKKYFALGLPQPNGKGFSLLNKGGFKMNVGKIKPVMFIVGEKPTKYKTFEAVLDFVSYKKMNPKESYNAIILNSTSQISQLHRLDFSKTTNELYLDHDTSGRKATNQILDLALANQIKNSKSNETFTITGFNMDKEMVYVELNSTAEKKELELSKLKSDYKSGFLEITRNSNNIDRSGFYQGYKDVNEYMVNEYQKKNEVDISQEITR